MAERTASAPPSDMRRFLIIWLGQAISIIGSGLTGFALGVWMFEATARATPFALTVLLSNLPRILLAPVAGSLVDRWNRRWLMILADTGDALVTLGAVGLVAGGRLEVWHVYLIATTSAIFAAFQEPAYTASIALLVPERDLTRANGLVQAAQAAESLLSPLLAGALLAVVGLPGIFAIDFATYLVAIAMVLLVKIPQPDALDEAEAGRAHRPSARVHGRLWNDLVYGWRYLAARPGLIGLLLYFALVNFLLNLAGVLTSPMVLSFAGPAALGAIQMGSGVGMLAGSIAISAWGGPKRRILGVVGAIVISSVGSMVMGLRPSAPLIGLGVTWFLFWIPIAGGCSQAIFQSRVSPASQGRVFAVRGMVARSMMPLAALLAGPLADRIFEPLMRPDGMLGRGWAGRILGTGPGRGIGLIYVISAGLIVISSLVAWSSRCIRHVGCERARERTAEAAELQGA